MFPAQPWDAVALLQPWSTPRALLLCAGQLCAEPNHTSGSQYLPARCSLPLSLVPGARNSPRTPPASPANTLPAQSGSDPVRLGKSKLAPAAPVDCPDN